ncbi:LuxR C-terminal-related transcriptional regulator [Myroides pelagicus]|uniref:HTH luxR-type domain-containing protein n=1 Tax=Myroides pelagicus TaxID=270914 RepID=A0A7K1GLB9_9FLAO|nr:LuxR C-terminal-related transcriptional regulator [Myroides pelagicus]MTH29233.1 hypothetical protein [Myroides pelagicus]
MELRKKEYYFLLVILLISSVVYPLSIQLQDITIDTPSISNTILEQTSDAQQDFSEETLALIQSNKDISMNFFVSGLFYGFIVIAITSTVVIYKIYGIKKWAAIYSVLLFMFGTQVYSDLLVHLTFQITLIERFVLKATVISLVFLTGLTISIHLPFRYKKLIHKNEFTAYKAATVLALVAYIANIYITSCHSYYFDFLVLSSFVVAQYLLNKVSIKCVYNQYIMLLLSLIVLFSASLTNTDITLDLSEYFDQVTELKFFSLFIILLGIFNNYILIKKYHNRQKKTEIFSSQYMLLVKNYHNLLVQSKDANAQDNDLVLNNSSDTAHSTITLTGEESSQDLKQLYKLTEREAEVLELIWEGMTNKEIAAALSISLSTTKYHISNIFIKLNVNSRTQLFSLKA